MDAVSANATPHIPTDGRRTVRDKSGFRYPTPLYPYQAVGIRTLVANQNFALLDEQGLGKSIQALYAGKALLNKTAVQAVVLVCRSNLGNVLAGEVEEHLPGERMQVINGDAGSLPNRQFDSTAKFFAVSYELLSRSIVNGKLAKDGLNLKRLLFRTRCALFLDESHYIGNPEANVTKVLLALAPYAKYRYIMTGTPVAHKVDGLWSQFMFLDMGATLGSSYEAFLNSYTIRQLKEYNGHNVWKVVSAKNVDELEQRISPKTLRRTLKTAGINLPPLVVRPNAVKAKPAQAALCKALRDNLVGLIGQSRFARKSIASILRDHSVARWLNDMLYAAAWPQLVDPAVKGNSKLALLQERLDEVDGQAVVWVWHKKVGRELHKVLGPKESALALGGMKNDPILRRFKNGDCRVLVASMDAFREGHTFTNASYAFYFELSWYLLNWTQTKKRLHRITQENRVVLDVPLLDTSLDSYILKSLKALEATAERVVDGKQGVLPDPPKLVEALQEF